MPSATGPSGLPEKTGALFEASGTEGRDFWWLRRESAASGRGVGARVEPKDTEALEDLEDLEMEGDFEPRKDRL